MNIVTTVILLQLYIYNFILALFFIDAAPLYTVQPGPVWMYTAVADIESPPFFVS